MTEQAQTYRSQRNASALVIITWVVASFLIFLTSFIAFLLAPLVLTVLIGGGMWLRETVEARRGGQSSQPAAAPAPPAVPAGDVDDSFRFGGRDER